MRPIRAAHLRKVEARLTRATKTLGNRALMAKSLRNVLPHYNGKTLNNRVSDIVTLVNDDVPELIAYALEMNAERVRLLNIIHSFHTQLENTIMEEDGVEVERKPHEYWEGYETPAHRED